MRALFVVPIYQFSRELRPVFEHFAAQGVDTHVLVGWTGPTAEEYAGRCAARGMTVHRVGPPYGYGDPFAKRSAGSDTPRVSRGRPWGLIDNARRARGALRRFRALRAGADALVERIEPDVILGGPYHSCGYIDEGIAWAARNRRIPLCCLSVSAYTGERNAVEARFSNVAAGMLSGLDARESVARRLLAGVFPSWTRSQGDMRIFAFDPWLMLASRLTGLLPRNPWRTPSEHYDVSFVESEFSRQMLLESGVDPAEVVVAGKPLLADVFARLEDPGSLGQIYQDLGLTEGEAFLLCNVEPSFEHRYSSWDDHWRRTRAVFDCLKRTEAPVVLSLHPLCEIDHYRPLAAECGFALSERWSIMDLYPLCAASVSFPCSTNTLAELFGRRLVVYDFFGHAREDAPRADLFRLPGAVYANDVGELSDALSNLLAEPGFPYAPARSTEGYTAASEIILREIYERFALGGVTAPTPERADAVVP